MAVDVDPMALRPIDGVMRNGAKAMETPKLNERLFRAVDLGSDDLTMYLPRSCVTALLWPV